MAWISTAYPGVRYREHATRKMRNGRPDRYYTIRYRVNGTRREEPLGWASNGWTPEKAHGHLASILEAIRTGDGPQSLAERRADESARRDAADAEARAQAARDMTFTAYVEGYYIPHARARKRSWDDDAQRLRTHILPIIGHMPLRMVSTEHAQGIIDAMDAAGYAPATQRQCIAVLRRAYNVAAETVADGIRLFSGDAPTRGVHMPAVHNARDRYLTRAEADSLIAAACGLRSPDLHDAIILSLNSGLRMGEVMRIAWDDIDFFGRMLTVKDAPRRKPGGSVPLNGAAYAVLLCRSEMQGHPRSGIIFPPIGGGRARENLSHMFKKLVDGLGMNDGITDARRRIVYHSLRHTFASWLALAGVDIYRIKTLMRHRTIAMTMRYAHLIPDATRDAVHSLMPPR